MRVDLDGNMGKGGEALYVSAPPAPTHPCFDEIEAVSACGEMLSLRRACVPSVLLLLSQLSRTEALLTGIAAPRRHGAVSVQANLLTKVG